MEFNILKQVTLNISLTFTMGSSSSPGKSLSKYHRPFCLSRWIKDSAFSFGYNFMISLALVPERALVAVVRASAFLEISTSTLR